MPHHGYEGHGYGHDTHGFAATHDYHPDVHLSLAGNQAAKYHYFGAGSGSGAGTGAGAGPGPGPGPNPNPGGTHVRVE